jgi:hypothetical protein
MLYVLFGVLLLVLIMFLFLRGKSSLEREIERKMKLGVELQRSGKLREYGELMREVEEMEREVGK